MSGLTILAPIGLLGLLGLPLVILYHMRHTTPEIRPVPTLRFWRAATDQQPEHERFRRPPLSLLLILQLALVALLALALSRPTASRALAGLGARTEAQHRIILLDGSTSMSARDGGRDRTRYEAARADAVDQLRGLHEGDVATVIVLGTHPVTLQATDAASMRVLRDRLQAFPAPGGRVDLNASLRLVGNLLLPDIADQVVLISDGALSASADVIAAVGAPISLIRVGDPASSNAAVTDIATRGSVTNPGQQQVFARIVNFSDQPATIPVVLDADGFSIGTQQVDLDANASRELTWDLPAGASSVTVRIDRPDALPADNSASAVLIQGERFGLRIVLVSDAPSALQRALAVLPGAQVDVLSSAEAADPESTRGYDLVAYEGVAPIGPVPASPILFVNQPEGGLLQTRGAMANPSVVRVHAGDRLLDGVELAGVTFGQTVVHELPANAVEIAGAESGPLIYRGLVPGSGEPMVVLTFDIAQSNLATRVAFPILIANAAGELAPSPLPSSVPLGDPLVYRPHAAAAKVRITPPDGTAVDLPVAAPSADAAAASGQLREVAFSDTGVAGTYLVSELDAKGADLGGGRFIVNAGHVRESDIRPNPDLPAVLSASRADEGGSSSGTRTDFWPILAALGLGVLLIEWLVALAPWRRARRRSLFSAPAGR